MYFSIQKHCLGRFWKVVLFLDMANQSHLPDSRSNTWPVQKPQAQCQYSYSPPVQHLHGRINTCRKPQQWFAQSYTSCVHTISSRMQINEQESPGRSTITSKKHSTCSMLTQYRSLKGMPSSNVLNLFHCVFQLIEFERLQFRYPFTREIPAFKIHAIWPLGKSWNSTTELSSFSQTKTQ